MSFGEENNFRIVSYKSDRWVIETSIALKDLDEFTLLNRIRSIKNDLSQKVSVPPSLLFFQNILDKTKTEEGLKVQFDIIRKNIKGGNPKVRFEARSTPDGITFQNMAAYIDLFYVDQFDNLIVFQRIKDEIISAGINRELVDFDSLGRRYNQVELDHIPQKNILIAEGKIPDIGSAAEIEYTFNAEQVESKLNKLMGATKVFEDDLLATIHPSGKGVNPGYDVLGTTLKPMEGMPLEFLDGNGTVISTDGALCSAITDGVVSINKNNLTRKISYGIERVVIQFQLSIDPIRMVDGSTVTELITDEHLEITGDLAKNAKIISKGKVFIDGKIHEGASIQSMDGLVVTGSIQSSSLEVSGDLIAEGDVAESSIVGEDSVELKGSTVRSKVSGKVIKAKEVRSSQIKAREKVDIGRIASGDIAGRTNVTRVEVEAKEFFQKQVNESEENIQEAASSLMRILELLGPDLAEEVGTRPSHIILLHFIAAEKKKGEKPFTRTQINAIKKLIEAAEPLTNHIDTKKKIIDDYKQKISKSGDGQSIIKIREKITAPVEIVMGDQRTRLMSGDEAKTITYQDSEKSITPNVQES